MIEAWSTGQRIRGRRRREHRPTLIVCDDLQNDSHISSAAQREATRRWFHGTLLKAGTKTTNVVNLATALHRDALALELHRSPGWTSERFAAIESWPTNLELWREWEEIYTAKGGRGSRGRGKESRPLPLPAFRPAPFPRRPRVLSSEQGSRCSPAPSFSGPRSKTSTR